MSIPVAPNDPRVRIFAKNTWTEVYRRVRQADGGLISIELGNDDEALGDEINPGICELTFDNLDGAFTPNNPASPFYPDLEVSTPICVLNDETRDLFSRVLSNSWGTATTGEIYTTASLGAPINATDYSVDGSVGKHSVPATNAYRMTYFANAASNAPIAYDGIWKIRFTLPFSDVTGTGNIEPANLVCRLQSNTQYYLLRVEITPSEQITIKLMRNDSVTLAGPITVPITYTGQPLWAALGAFDSNLYGTVWAGDTLNDEPTGWLISATDSTYGYGYYGVRTGVATGNTNTLPIVASYDYYTAYIPQFCGDVPEWPQEFSEDGIDKIVPIKAGGILRRFTETKAPRPSPLRYHYETELGLIFGTAPDYYWPLDDGELSSESRKTIGPSSSPFHLNFSLGVLVNLDTSREKHFSQAKMGAWLPNGVNVLPTEIFQTLPPAGTADCIGDRFVVDWVRTGGSGTDDQFVINGYLDPGVFILGINGDIFSVSCDSVAKTISIAPGLNETAVVLDSTLQPINVFDGAAHHFRFRANSTGGAPTDLFWELTVDDHVLASGTDIDHPFLASVGAIYMTSLTGTEKPTGICSVALFVTNDPDSSISTTYLRFTGSLAEKADTRALRLCTNEAGIQSFTNSSNGMTMGPQFTGDTFFEMFEEITRTDGGIFREYQRSRGINYDTLEVLRANQVILTLDVSAQQIAQDGYRPVRDNQKLRNKIVASKRSGGDYTYAKTTGRLGTADPKLGGAGEYPGDTKVNPELDSQLIQIAQREVSEGTVDKPRYPEVVVDLMGTNIRANALLRKQILNVFVSQRIKLTNMQKWFQFEDADLLVIGHKRLLSPFIHQITWNTIPYKSLDIFHVETAGSILGTNSSFLASAIGIADTALDVYTTGRQTLWTVTPASFPITARCEGEDIRVDDIDTNAPSFRSVGAVSHGDNATLNPALPAGQLVGDHLICISVIRNTSAFANVPAGYTPHVSNGHFMISSKISVGAGETAPSCTYSGGAAGDTTSAFVIACPNLTQLGHSDGNLFVNASAQNIAIPTVLPTKSNGIFWMFAWKQDNWTSVAPPLWLTEVVDTSTITGNDQGVWAGYQLIPYNRDATPTDTLVVTGGASAVSRAVGLYFANPQRFTVTRNRNNLPGGKTHPVNAALTIAYPKVLG